MKKNTEKIYIFAFGPRRHPKMAQYETSRWHLGVKMAQDCLKKAQDGPKMAPRRPNTAPRCSRKTSKNIRKINVFALGLPKHPKSHHIGPSCGVDAVQERKRRFSLCFFMFWGGTGGHVGPSRGHLGPQEGPRWLQDGPKKAKHCT